MAVFAIHKTMGGEPIGVWNDSNESAYAAGYEGRVEDGRQTVSAKGYAVPWSVFVRRLASTVNHHEWWGAQDRSGTPDEVLDAVRSDFFSRQASRTPRDR